MDWDLYCKIVDEAETIPQIDHLAFAGLCEPLLDTRIEERVAYARKARDWHIELYTNGVFLTPKKFESLKSAGLSAVHVSLNAVNSEQHERVMGLHDKFDLVCENTDYACAHRGNMYIRVRTAMDGTEFTLVDAGEFVRRWGLVRSGGDGQPVHEYNWGGDRETKRRFNPNECCYRAYQIAVSYDGRIGLCCLDPLCRHQVWGNLRTQTLREVYNAEPYVKFRELHYLDRAEEHPVCAKCTRG
jgi:hypothetical protein